MTKKLSSAFFGDKKLTEKAYQQLLSSKLSPQHIQAIFQPYTSKLKSINTNPNSPSLLQIFVEFLQGAINQFKNWPFQKLSSTAQIAAHVFEYSFEHWLTREQSFRYFSEVVVRHSLFRPPHSVCIFEYEELNTLTTWWMSHFDRYYEEYQQCFATSLNQFLICSALPSEAFMEQTLGEGKLCDRSEIGKLLQ